jgi:hypothetical protein
VSYFDRHNRPGNIRQNCHQMGNVVITKQEQLPDDLRMLLGKKFVPADHTDILYISGSVSIHSLARIPFYLCLAMTALAGIFWLYNLITELTKWNRHSEFRNEGVIITFIIFAFMSLMLLLCASYLRRSKRLQERIASGEIRYGMWITPTHLLSHDLNEGLKCVAKKEIASLDIYRSGRPPHLEMVLVQLNNKQVIRIAADWLVGYYKKVDALKELIERKLLSDKIRLDVIDHFLNSCSTPDSRHNRFFQLARFVENYDEQNKLDPAEKSELINYVNKNIGGWSPAERVAEQEWWVEINTVENWEYGVNGVTWYQEVKGFPKEPHWMMPLARSAVLESEQADLLAKQNVDEFIEADSYSGLEGLKLMIDLGDYCIQRIMESGKFAHLKVLHTPHVCSNDKELGKQFAAWKSEHNIEST